MRRFLLHLLLGAVMLGVIGAVVVVAGVVPIKASSGHWRITEAFLQFAKRRSVSTWSMGTAVPPLDDRRLVLRGATHYEGGCRPCHGAPGADTWEPSETMTPVPPPLDARVDDWDREELFFIVKHGIKFTGMPAFPAVARDDEIWSVVAFLLALPGMTGRDYLQLAWGELASSTATDSAASLQAGDALVLCERCHGLAGEGRQGAFPSLAGQSPLYLASTLRAYASGARNSGIMQPIATELDSTMMRALAARFGRTGGDVLDRAVPPAGDPFPVTRTLVQGELPLSAPAVDPAAVERGRAIAHEGIPDRKVPACVQCHGPVGWARNPHYPALAGQYADYTVQQLELFRTGLRGGTEYSAIMQTIARVLEPTDMIAVARYYASLAR